MENFENNDIADQVQQPEHEMQNEQIVDAEQVINKQEVQEEKLAILNSVAELNTLKSTIKDFEKTPNLEAKIEAVSTNHENSTTPVALHNNKQSDIWSLIAAQSPGSSPEAQKWRIDAYNRVEDAISSLPFGLDKFFSNA